MTLFFRSSPNRPVQPQRVQSNRKLTQDAFTARHQSAKAQISLEKLQIRDRTRIAVKPDSARYCHLALGRSKTRDRRALAPGPAHTKRSETYVQGVSCPALREMVIASQSLWYWPLDHFYGNGLSMVMASRWLWPLDGYGLSIIWSPTCAPRL